MKIDSIMLVEPDNPAPLYPFSTLHPIWELRCGALRLFEKIKLKFPEAKIMYHGRKNITASFAKRFAIDDRDIEKENLLILNAAVIPNEDLWKNIEQGYDNYLKSNQGWSKTAIFGDDINPVAVYIPAEELISPTEMDKEFLPRMLSQMNFIPEKVTLENVKFIHHIWDSIYENGNAINDDLVLLKNKYKQVKSENFPGAAFIKPEEVYAGNSSIYPNVTLDASDGPIIIGDNVKILPNTYLQGPLFLGDNSLIKAGSKIYGQTSIGEWCKIGGELENTIVQSYSNKQHEGFLGHSFLGEWVNLGADTNNSDLKNTYGNIKVNQDGEEIDSGRMFLGLICGDHTKTAINTQFNTGTIAGICGIIVTEGFPPNNIPAFSWGGKKDSQLYKANKAVEVAKIVMKRRNKELLPEEEELIREEYNRTLNKKLTSFQKS